MIRLLGTEDAAAWRVLRLHMLETEPQAFCSTFADVSQRPAGFFAEWIETRRVFAAEMGGQLAGAAAWYRNSGAVTGHRGEVVAVYLRPELRGSGLIDQLLASILVDATGKVAQLELDVNAGNPAAIRAYARNGFAEVARLPRYMKHGEIYSDAIRMVRVLES